MHQSGTSSPRNVPPNTPQHAPGGTNNHKDSTPKHFAKSPVEGRADYSRSNFETLNNKSEPKSKPGDIFGDLLGSQGYQFATKKDNFPKTINDMRKVELSKDMDPDKLKIMEWVRMSLKYFVIFNNN